MELTQHQATILRAIAVTYHTEAFADTLMGLCGLGSKRFQAEARHLQDEKLIESSPEELKRLADAQAPRDLYSLTPKGASVLTTELALPPIEMIELRRAKTYKLQLAPSRRELLGGLQATVCDGINTLTFALEGGREQEVIVSGFVRVYGGHVVHGETSDPGWDFTATVKKHMTHPTIPNLDIVFGTIRYH